MFKISTIITLIKTAYSLAIGSKAKIAILAIALSVLSISLWYMYDDMFVQPLENSKKETKECLVRLDNIYSLMEDNAKEYDANISTLNAYLKKCNFETGIYAKESYDKGYIKGIKDAESNKTVTKNDIDAICFQPYF